MKPATIWAIALAAALLVAGTRWFYETSITSLVAYDAQGGIWIAYSLIASTATALVCFLTIFFSLRSFGKQNRQGGIILFCAFLFVALWTTNTLFDYADTRRALTDAADPNTPSERLRDLVGYQTGFGYEIDNRVASNPNTPTDVLRSLHGKPHQAGTEVCLAQNPKTPDDVLLSLSQSDDQWTQKALKDNPSFKKIDVQQGVSGQPATTPRVGD